MHPILNQLPRKRDLDRIRGCLIGGAAGDALGYPVEFLSEKAIRARFGDKGITEYSLQDGVALVSDDTQMTMFTANGLLTAITRSCKLLDVLTELADDLYYGCPLSEGKRPAAPRDIAWEKKYVYPEKGND